MALAEILVPKLRSNGDGAPPCGGKGGITLLFTLHSHSAAVKIPAFFFIKRCDQHFLFPEETQEKLTEMKAFFQIFFFISKGSYLLTLLAVLGLKLLISPNLH